MVDMEREATHPLSVYPSNEHLQRVWAVEQVMGALVEGNNAPVKAIIEAADQLVAYVRTGKKPS